MTIRQTKKGKKTLENKGFVNLFKKMREGCLMPSKGVCRKCIFCRIIEKRAEEKLRVFAVKMPAEGSAGI